LAVVRADSGGTYHPSQGAPGISTRLMVALHYLKYQLDLSDEDVVAAWVKILLAALQRHEALQHRMPIDPSSMTRWRKRLAKPEPSRCCAPRSKRDEDAGDSSCGAEAHQRGTT